MRNRAPALLIASVVLLSWADVARAGMPSVTLTDLARLRVQTISFFLLGVLASAWAVRLLWNGLRADFPRLPRLSFGKALGVVSLWGLLFVLVLTMVSGARELMTPGAWAKQGFTYELAGPPPASPLEDEEEGRRRSLDRLRIALWTYARGHDMRFPTAEDSGVIPEDAWRVPGPSGMRYVYVPGHAAGAGQDPLAYEPGIFGEEQLVLLTDGRIVSMASVESPRSPGEEQGR